MKKLILIFFLLSGYCFGQNSNEVFLFESEEGDKDYILTDQIIEMPNGQISLWTKTVHKGIVFDEEFKTHRHYYLSRLLLDCNEKYMVITDIYVYSVDKKLIGSFNNKYDKSIIVPYSYGETLYNYVCPKK